MRKNIYITIFFSFLVTLCSYAQESIVKDLNQPKKGEGTVNLYQDESITRAVLSQPSTVQQSTIGSTNPITASNSTTDVKKNARVYRVQIFHGNDQGSKREANRRRDLVKERFPQLNVSISYSAPSWTVRAGNFATRADAQKVLGELQAAFPAFGKEMYVR